MSNTRRIRLELNFDNVGTAAEEILEMYANTHMAGDLDQLAWNLAGCDSERQAAEIGGPGIESCDVKRSQNGGVELEAVLLFTGDDQVLILKTVEEYLDAFEDYVRDTVLEYRSRTGKRAGFEGSPASRNYNIFAEGPGSD